MVKEGKKVRFFFPKKNRGNIMNYVSELVCFPAIKIKTTIDFLRFFSYIVFV